MSLVAHLPWFDGWRIARFAKKRPKTVRQSKRAEPLEQSHNKDVAGICQNGMRETVALWHDLPRPMHPRQHLEKAIGGSHRVEVSDSHFPFVNTVVRPPRLRVIWLFAVSNSKTAPTLISNRFCAV